MRRARFCAAVLVLGCAVSATSAADLGSPQAALGGPVYGPPTPLWSGLYLGAHIGYGAARASGTSFDGFLGGIQLGYNAEIARNVILGVETDLSGADLSHGNGTALFGVPGAGSTQTSVLGTARARLGFTFDQFMIYGTGGFAWAVNRVSGTFGGVGVSDTQLHTGYTFGAGMEWMIAPAWTARAEYLYAHFGSQTYGGVVATGGVDANIVRIGVNYLFK
jgi:outer membrane immunogenic protein